MKTFQLTIRINGVELATIIHAANAEQAKLIAGVRELLLLQSFKP